MHMIAAVLLAVAAQTVPFTLERLELDLNVDYARERVDGVARLTVRNTSQQPVDRVPLVLGRLMTVKSAGGLRFEQAIGVFEDQTIRQVNFLTIHLADPVPPGGMRAIAIDYGGHIVPYTETGNLYVHDTIAPDFTIIREDAYAFPTLGISSRAANRAIARNGFTFDAHITVPRGFVVASGSLVDQKDGTDTTTFHFATSEPAPFLNLSIAKFGVLDDSGVRIYYLPADAEGAKLVMQKTQKALAQLAEWLGPLGKEAKLTIIEIPEGWGSQAGLIPGIILTADSFHNPTYLIALYHELGHLWNPDELDRPPARLNEGESMWLQWAMAEQLDGMTPEGFAKAVNRTVGRVANEPKLATVPLHSYGVASMTDWSYSVGFLYFTLLEKVIGRDALLGVFRDYYQKNRQQGATLDQFLALLEQRYPKAKAIDDDWIRSTKWYSELQRAKSLEAITSLY